MAIFRRTARRGESCDPHRVRTTRPTQAHPDADIPRCRVAYSISNSFRDSPAILSISKGAKFGGFAPTSKGGQVESLDRRKWKGEGIESRDTEEETSGWGASERCAEQKGQVKNFSFPIGPCVRSLARAHPCISCHFFMRRNEIAGGIKDAEVDLPRADDDDDSNGDGGGDQTGSVISLN